VAPDVSALRERAVPERLAKTEIVNAALKRYLNST
jgi:hypothetical protein